MPDRGIGGGGGGHKASRGGKGKKRVLPGGGEGGGGGGHNGSSRVEQEHDGLPQAGDRGRRRRGDQQIPLPSPYGTATGVHYYTGAAVWCIRA